MIELAITFLGVYVVKKGLGPLDREVDAKLDSLWARVRDQLGRSGQGQQALMEFEAHPDDRQARAQLEGELRSAIDEDEGFKHDVAEWIQHVDSAVLDAWIAADTGADLRTVSQVMDLELEYMEGVGIAEGYREEFLYYRREDLEALPEEEKRILDEQKLAADASHFLGVPDSLALEILQSEVRYLQLRGIAGPEIDPE